MAALDVINLINVVLSKYLPITDDRSVKFGGVPYPKNGWAIFTCGGPGSGKSYTINKQLMIDAKVLDSDQIKMLYIKLLKKIISSPKVDEETKKQLLEPFGGKIPDPKNPNDMDTLHKFTSWKKHLFSKSLSSFIKSSAKNLQNFIIDTTGNNINEIALNATMFKNMGYKVALVWVITNIDLARIRNRTRDRVVPEDYLENIHHKIISTIPATIRNGLLNVLDEIWIVFSKDSEEREFRSRFKDTAFKLEKVNGKFILTDDMLQKITQHATGGRTPDD